MSRYQIVIVPYLLGQCRVQIHDYARCDGNGLPDIPQELCTYDPHKAALVRDLLAAAADPVALARTWASPWNTEMRASNSRIRLDNERRGFTL